DATVIAYPTLFRSKILRVMSSDRYPLPLRTEAAMAMIELDRPDVASLHDLGLALDALSGREPEAAAAIVKGLAPRLEALMKGGAGEPATASQIRAKDAAFRLVPLAYEVSAAKLTDAVAAIYVADVPCRSLA